MTQQTYFHILINFILSLNSYKYHICRLYKSSSFKCGIFGEKGIKRDLLDKAEVFLFAREDNLLILAKLNIDPILYFNIYLSNLNEV
jgi:hypothetical protein